MLQQQNQQNSISSAPSTISKPPVGDSEDFFRHDISREFQHEKVISEPFLSSNDSRSEGIDLHAIPDENIENDPSTPTNDRPFSAQQIELLKMVISESIDKKLSSFQVPNLNETMDDVCQTLFDRDLSFQG